MKICVSTSTRAEYGLLKPLMDNIKKDIDLELQILVTGAHLSPEFGLTYRIINEDGFTIDSKVEMLLSSDTPEGIVKSMGLGMIGFSEAFKILDPDVLVILGDRYEMLALASTALIFKIPIAHIHGGELTEGAYDDSIRHAITKMSLIHFTSTEEYRKRVIQLGEQPEFVFNVGALGMDNISKLNFLKRDELEFELGVKFARHNYQVTFHPATLESACPQDQFQLLLNAIDLQENSFFIFTKTNADTAGRIINQMIDEYVSQNPEKASAFVSLGSLKFLSLVKICDAIVGNSSSGILEAPFLLTPTINIGNRQKGRLRTGSIIDVGVSQKEIMDAFELVKSEQFKLGFNNNSNPYGDGDTVSKIIGHIRNFDRTKLNFKDFFDINYEII